MDITKSTKKYERWLGRQTEVVDRELKYKHHEMRQDAFMFLRATFYRWIQVWPSICTDLAMAPKVLAIGDLHIENFGTWRDAEGRLVWGVNDFDEAYELPYTNDLVRLAVSAALAKAKKRSRASFEAMCEAILAGYMRGLEAGGEPYVLEERHGWLRDIAMGELRNPVKFWKKMDKLKRAKRGVPVAAVDAIKTALPQGATQLKIVDRTAGLGSLGHVRLVGIADCHGGKIAREVKALVPSACAWAAGKEDAESKAEDTMRRAVRCADPFVQFSGKWLVRRLSPHCCAVELADMPAERNKLELLSAMGWETANIHLGSAHALPELKSHLKKQPSAWLSKASADMMEATESDWHAWRKAGA